MKRVYFRDLGAVEYADAWRIQEEMFNELVDRKLFNRSVPEDQQREQIHYLVFCEHPHVFTLGRTGDEKNLLLDSKQLVAREAAFFKNNRGGDITYHGPGQIVGYPILDLDCFFTDIHLYMRTLEEAVIRTMNHYGLSGDRFPGYTGVWLEPADPSRARKICAMGVRCSRWVTMHGFAFNVNTDLSYFNHIIPCGINDKSVTSLQKELGYTPDIHEVKIILRSHLADLFGMELIPEEGKNNHA
ncbi:MAG: lipoyl(octanoyl) transferase LipB [Bacteroidota bacterium]